MSKIEHPPEQLFHSLEGSIPSSFPVDSFVVITASCLITIGRGDAIGDLFAYLRQRPELKETDLSRKLREIIQKTWTLVGIPRAIGASYSLQSADPDGDQADWDRRQAFLSDANALRATSSRWFSKVFGAENEATIFAKMKNNKELEWTLRHIIYGMYLGDLTILSDIENEFLVATCVVMTGGPKSPSLTHLRALLFMGVPRDHVEVFERICHEICVWAGIDPSFRVRLCDLVLEAQSRGT